MLVVEHPDRRLSPRAVNLLKAGTGRTSSGAGRAPIGDHPGRTRMLGPSLLPADRPTSGAGSKESDFDERRSQLAHADQNYPGRMDRDRGPGGPDRTSRLFRRRGARSPCVPAEEGRSPEVPRAEQGRREPHCQGARSPIGPGFAGGYGCVASPIPRRASCPDPARECRGPSLRRRDTSPLHPPLPSDASPLLRVLDRFPLLQGVPLPCQAHRFLADRPADSR
jgi:hypothetical protein